MNPVLLIDFGSAYAKLTAVDTDAAKILSTAQSYTTVQTDINDGLNNGLSLLAEECGELDFSSRFACSSAAGGLKMIASGLVPALTTKAAKQASLGAGAKLMKTYSFELTEDDLREIAMARPDIFLLCGGTDGGDTEHITHNAEMLASMQPDFPIIYAGNRSCARECAEILADTNLTVCENVMPRLEELNIDSAQAKIREVFLNNIVSAKGLSEASELLDEIVMPTPSAVKKALELLAEGTKGEPGIGDLVALDVGGATTDVYSIADGLPTGTNVVFKGLEEPYSKRSVEGDIGMRYSIKGIVEAAGLKEIASLAQMEESRAAELIDFLSENTDTLPADNEELRLLDYALASAAVRTAMARHAGTIKESYTVMGQVYVQSGKDLTAVEKMIVTGGSLVRSKDAAKIATHAFYSQEDFASLRPKNAEIFIDDKYIIAAMGLLAGKYPDAALKILRKELKNG